MVLITLCPQIRMTDSQEEDSLTVPAPGVGGRQARRTLECQTSHSTPMSGQSASLLGELNLTYSLINQQTKEICQPYFHCFKICIIRPTFTSRLRILSRQLSNAELPKRSLFRQKVSFRDQIQIQLPKGSLKHQKTPYLYFYIPNNA